MNQRPSTDNGMGFVQGLKSCVEEHPISSTFTSLATGFCVGLLLTRLVESAVVPAHSRSYADWMGEMGHSVRDSLGRIVPRQLHG